MLWQEESFLCDFVKGSPRGPCNGQKVFFTDSFLCPRCWDGLECVGMAGMAGEAGEAGMVANGEV